MPATSLIITHREMQHARDAGRARPLTAAITEFASYWGDWWITSADGWLRITDTHLASRLSQIRARLDQADEDNACIISQKKYEEEWS
jgi:hypothetical protein